MKLYKIEMKDVYQFADITIDLTYPEGHPKAGQPLDKVCVIGQSGTGKTKLLRLIHDLILSASPLPFKTKNYRSPNGNVYAEINHEKVNIGLSPVNRDATYVSYFDGDRNTVVIDENTLFNKYQNAENGPLMVFYPHHLKDSLNKSNNVARIAGTNETFELDQPLPTSQKFNPDEKYWYYDFSEINVELMWAYILKDVREYRKNKIALDTEFADRVKAAPHKFEEERKRLEEWDLSNPNPLETIAKKFDIILQRFYLKISTQITGSVIDNVKQSHIPARHSMTNQEFDFFDLSTGIQRIINTGIPLYQLKPKDAVIIFDEVENSLYPDVQKDIIKFYQELAPSCQFIFATHSPIIASNFEPWEIVELKFNDEGKVYREEYYKSERHVDNYFIHPEVLRWDEILTDVFDLKVEGNEKRNKMLQELANLQMEIKALQKRNESEQLIEKKIERYKKVANILNWRIDAKDN